MGGLYVRPMIRKVANGLPPALRAMMVKGDETWDGRNQALAIRDCRHMRGSRPQISSMFFQSHVGVVREQENGIESWCFGGGI